MTLPNMTVEARESTTAHGIKRPNLTPRNLAAQIQEALQLNQDAIRAGWTIETLDILRKYVSGSPSDSEIIAAVENVGGFKSWGEVSTFVIDDECLEFFNLALKYCKKQGQKHVRDKGFIDGSGIGYVREYTKRLKVTLEQAFDAKYYFKVKRPLAYSLDVQKMDLSKVANAIHPAHWAYPAGHGTKFLTAVEVLGDLFHLDKNCYNELLLAAEVLSMGRSGSLIHYPQDNLAGGSLTTLKEYN